MRADQARLSQARDWAARQLQQRTVDLVPVSGDASFRRYFRLQTATGTLILMDAPPQHENSESFLDVSRRLRQAGLHAPEILQFDLQQGFGLLEDLGDELYRDVLNPDNVESHFPLLFRVLLQMAEKADCGGLPEYDDSRLQQELDLFVDWYLLHHRQRSMPPAELRSWKALCAELKLSAGQQPQVFVHRDFHSCNLLYREEQNPGIIDFQDALKGPISYDFVSLLWDRYIAWPRTKMEHWMESYLQLLATDVDSATWRRWCDLMGLQRNLKIVGIFARLHYRDGKGGYLEMIPRFYRYLLDVLPLYPEFHDFLELLEQPECAP